MARILSITSTECSRSRLWDTRKKRLILARDRFGEKPLYYGVFDGKLIYASEPKALLAHPSVKAELDPDALRHYLSFDYVPAPRSIYKGICKLPAAHILTVENGEIKTRRYWNLSFEQERAHDRPIEKAATELRDLLSDAVRMRLVVGRSAGHFAFRRRRFVDCRRFCDAACDRESQDIFYRFSRKIRLTRSKFAREVAAHLGTEHYEEILSVRKSRRPDLRDRQLARRTAVRRLADSDLFARALCPQTRHRRARRRRRRRAFCRLSDVLRTQGRCDAYATVPHLYDRGLIEPVVRRSARFDKKSFV